MRNDSGNAQGYDVNNTTKLRVSFVSPTSVVDGSFPFIFLSYGHSNWDKLSPPSRIDRDISPTSHQQNDISCCSSLKKPSKKENQLS